MTRENFFQFGNSLVRQLAREKKTEFVQIYFEAELKAQSGVLTALFEMICAGLAATSAAEQRLFELNKMPPSDKVGIAELVDQRRVATANFDAHLATTSAFAGALFVILNTLIFETAAKLGLKPNDVTFGRRIHGEFLALIIRSTSDNFRHYEEWATTGPKKNASRDRLLAIGLPECEHRSVSADVFVLVNWQNADEMIAEVTDIVCKMCS